jgi:hypothetical protein
MGGNIYPTTTGLVVVDNLPLDAQSGFHQHLPREIRVTVPGSMPATKPTNLDKISRRSPAQDDGCWCARFANR